MLLLRRWRGFRTPRGAAVTNHRCDYREFLAVTTSQARGGRRGPREAPRGGPPFGPSNRGQTAAGRGGRERNNVFHDQLSSDKATTGLFGVSASSGLRPQERFPRPDLDVESLREEQRHVQNASKWKVVTITTNTESDLSAATVGFAEITGSPISVPKHSVSLDEGEASRLSAGEELEKIRADRRARRRPPTPCLYDDGGTLPTYGGLTATAAEHQKPFEENPAGCSSTKAAIGTTFFSEGPTDWRLEITEDFDAEWSRLSGSPFDEDAGGPPWGPPADRLEDKRLKVFVPELGVAPKAVAALNRFQVLRVLENPAEALNLSMDQRNTQGAPFSSTLPPEVYEALAERMIKILPSFDRQQLMRLVRLQEQHVHALQQQHLLLLQRARTLRLQAAATAEHEQQQQHQQLATAKAVESEAAAAAAKRGLKALQQQPLLDQLFDALLPHLAHMSLEELGCVSRALVVSLPRKSFGLLQVLVLHAVDRVAALQWSPLPETPTAPRKLACKALMVLQPLAVANLRVMETGAPRCHRSPEGARSRPFSVEGPLANLGEAPEDAGGALGFACRRLLEAISDEAELKEYLPRSLVLQLLLCCCSVGSGAISAAYKVAKKCIDLLLEGPQQKGAAFSDFSVEEALRILISCSYLETRGGPPTWQLPLFKQLLGAPPSGAESLHGAEGSQMVCIKSSGAILGPPLLPRCSPGLVCSRSRPAALLSTHQIETLIDLLEKALPSRASLEDALSALPLLRGDTQQLMQRAAACNSRYLPETSTDETIDLEGGLEEWAITVEVRSVEEPSSCAPFDYLKEDEGEQPQVKEAAIPAAVALAATEGVAWALSRLLQLQQQHQANHEQQQQQQALLQQQRLQESIRKTLNLLLLLVSRLAASTEDPRVSPSAFIQGAHALADAAENLLSAFAADCHKSVEQMEELRVATSALIQTEASLLLTAAARAAQGRDVPHAFIKANVEAISCCISRSLGALRVLRLHAPSQERSLDGEAERAAVAAFVRAAKDCLRCCRPTTWLDETQQTSISEEIAHALVAMAATWGYPEASGKVLQADRDLYTIVGALDAFLTCAQPLISKGLSHSSETTALSSKATASAARTGLERMLKQVSRLLPLASESELRAAADLSTRLQQLQQELVKERDSQGASLSSTKSAQEILRDALNALDKGLLDQLNCGHHHGEGRHKASQFQLKKKLTF
ncbi:hypothetical protein Emed_007498 [Eimeria media]